MNRSTSILIGGQAGYGIDKSSLVLARILGRLGYYVYIYRDYPSLIRGGHTFSIIRIARERIAAHSNKVDFLLALNQETVVLHKEKLLPKGVLIFDLDAIKSEGDGIPIGAIIKEEKASEIMRNSCLVGSFCRTAGIDWAVLEDVFHLEMSKELELNLKVARRGYDAAPERQKIEKIGPPNLPFLTGNEAIALGLLKGGLKAYIAYPMTPTSTILHFMAAAAGDFGLKVIQPESEIGVMLMALGFSYTGDKVAVGTSGGGFCLMTEGLSFAGMAELPIVIILGMRPGPSTGLPTYSSQTELHFALNAGQGEFPRLIAAPGDPEEACYWSAVALNLSWKFRLPAFILTDKNLSEGTFNFNLDALPPPVKEEISSAPPKIDSYEHDEAGITTEDPAITKTMQARRLGKEKMLLTEVERLETVKIYGNKFSSTAVLCWGSNKGVCVEAAAKFGIKVIHLVVVSPFSQKQFARALKGVKKLICVENNATGQLARLISQSGFSVDDKILKYDGRPFALDELELELKKRLK